MIIEKRVTKKQNTRRGFTLVEVIVVLVVLAILAAVLVPTMIGWIRKANEKAAIVEAENILRAAQTFAVEMAANPDAEWKENDGTIVLKNFGPPYSGSVKEIMELAELSDPDAASGELEDDIIFKNYKVDTFTYKIPAATITYHAQPGGSGENSYTAGFTIEPN
ncbi:prepilin-type N-terminal cleavage/methylation domain-containing protein [Anaerovorax odorimutans]|uniref:Prepilin-type N-terminal cleavage/methylation domain-containing protein n=1 Tax=Anaerovorax odorimutans TaxID=109327 RepID=A0ABT1RS44_9FIRM|nr:prepilin-type N-terminal cleavage/methylation domain-containing protein [Anaerovorax odorimutans]MCQ4638024.1 prepilin-type N-terminal cleavage/methylation domain-containing protein [Anaerovorax odorimutans]